MFVFLLQSKTLRMVKALYIEDDKKIFFKVYVHSYVGLPWWLSAKESAYECRRLGFNPLVGKMPCRRKWQPTPGFLPGKSHGQRSLAGYSLWGRKRVRYDLATKQQ